MKETLLEKVKTETIESLLHVTTAVVKEIKDLEPDMHERIHDELYIRVLSLTLDITRVLKHKTLEGQKDTHQ